MPLKGLLKRFGIKKDDSAKKVKPVRKHHYDEVTDEQLQAARAAPKRRPRPYDEIEIDQEDGPTVVDGSPDAASTRETSKTLNYIEVEVSPPDPNSEVRRSEPPTQYSTVEVGADAGNKRRVSIDLQE